uniref:Uncharacterized protein n=1 Tax=Octopus bimaculoides TaxID=37653 RepID=A0A0L8H592_OCTBM
MRKRSLVMDYPETEIKRNGVYNEMICSLISRMCNKQWSLFASENDDDRDDDDDDDDNDDDDDDDDDG